MTPFSKFTSKDLIYVGIFTVVYLILGFAFGALGALNPIMQAVGAMLGVIANGIVIMVFLTKVRRPGALFLLVVLAAVARILFGDAWPVVAMVIVFGTLADFVAARGDYRNLNRNIFAYGLLSLAPVGSLLPMIYMGDEYFAKVAQQMGEDYAHSMQMLYTPGFIGIMTVILFILALLGGFIGKLVVQRSFAHFDADATAVVGQSSAAAEASADDGTANDADGSTANGAGEGTVTEANSSPDTDAGKGTVTP